MNRLFEKRYLTTGEIGEVCGVSYRTVNRWAASGRLKAHRLPGRGDFRVIPRHLVEFLSDHAMHIPEELQDSAPRVLIVEDEELMARAIHRALKRAGFETMTANDGFLAGALASIFNPTVMTLDLKMPGLAGLDVLKAIRSLPELARIRVLIVSAMPDEELQAAIEFGADDVLEKPFKNKDLVEKVRLLAGVSVELRAG